MRPYERNELKLLKHMDFASGDGSEQDGDLGNLKKGGVRVF